LEGCTEFRGRVDGNEGEVVRTSFRGSGWHLLPAKVGGWSVTLEMRTRGREAG